MRIHKKLNYAPEKLEVVPNGFDLEQIKYDPAARASIREELGIPPDAIIIGIASRFHPNKDLHNFVRAGAQLHGQLPRIHFLLCGLNITWQNAQLVRWIEAAGIRDHCHLLGVRPDMPRLFAAMDIATNTSQSEAFPVAIGEAMACETPCVVTDVGDSALIVGETGLVVPTRRSAGAGPGMVDAPASWTRCAAPPRRRRQEPRAATFLLAGNCRTL